ncbi:cytochrome P450 [Nocardia carnea]|uniref:cytochrome P450 n=1 Tax=Nocardia carnea TaxID=37328 RepID=UPI002453C344|nr:cytochrome P450 [Nocardia carnea]
MSFGRDAVCPAREGSPGEANSQTVRFHGAEYFADPGAVYRDARQRFGALVPAELADGVPATVVVGYKMALQILRHPDQFPADSRAWQQGAPAGCPALSVLEYRPDPRRTAGAEHERYRSTHTAVLGEVDQHELLSVVEQIAVSLINGFCGRGSADLCAEFAWPLAFEVIGHLLGITEPGTEQMMRTAAAVAEATDASSADAARNALEAILTEVVREKAAAPGRDMISGLIAHPAGLSEHEVVAQLALIYEMGVEPTAALILNTLRAMLAGDQLDGAVGGAVSTRDALDEVLFNDPPIPNACVTFPPRPQLLGEVWLWENTPVVISLAACNQDPSVRRRDPATDSGVRGGNRSHLSWGLGEHACPANEIALLIAATAIDQLMDALPDMSVAVPEDRLTWRTDPFRRSLTALPVLFPPAPPLPAP